MDWLNDLLPKLRCPDTHQSLRWPTEAELAQFPLPTTPEGKVLATPAPSSTPSALITEDGTRLYLIDKGIPVLLPGSAILLATQK